MKALGVQGEARIRRAGLARFFGVMVVKKREGYPPRRFVVSYCFACCAIISAGERNMVSLFWGDGDPGRDEVVEAGRETVVRMCRSCREAVVEKTGIEVRLGNLRVGLALDEEVAASKTGAHGILRTRVVRRVVS